jgi:hypothetical protein
VRSRAMNGDEARNPLTFINGSIGIMLDNFESPLDAKEAACRIVKDDRKHVS